MRDDQFAFVLDALYANVDLGAAWLVTTVDAILERPWETARPLQRFIDRIVVPR